MSTTHWYQTPPKPAWTCVGEDGQEEPTVLAIPSWTRGHSDPGPHNKWALTYLPRRRHSGMAGISLNESLSLWFQWWHKAIGYHQKQEAELSEVGSFCLWLLRTHPNFWPSDRSQQACMTSVGWWKYLGREPPGLYCVNLGRQVFAVNGNGIN